MCKCECEGARGGRGRSGDAGACVASAIAQGMEDVWDSMEKARDVEEEEKDCYSMSAVFTGETAKCTFGKVLLLTMLSQ